MPLGLLKRKGSKVLLLGLDCADPHLVFDRFTDKLPNLSRLMDEGAYGRIRSVHPPITAPAWACMLSGKSPGELGVYGFRHRRLGSYTEKYFAFSDRIKARRVWDILSAEGKKVIVLGLPQTFPVKPVNGLMVSSFLTPSTSVQYTYPPELKGEVEGVSRFQGRYSTDQKGYMLDVENFRSPDKDRVLHEIYEMTEKQFAVMRHLMSTREWDFFATVFMGPDRVHHGFWKYMDPEHKDYQPGNKYEHAIEEYYKFIDEEIGQVLRLADGAKVLVVSDHGAKRLDGCICINEWLIQNGYLKLEREPLEMEQLPEGEIDWSKTAAWGWGGYYGRIFINLAGREPQGIVPSAEYEPLRDELIKKLEALTDQEGRNIGTRAYRPQELYQEVNGDPPDLFVYFGDLYWRSSASVGLGSLYLGENDTGPDHANHDWDGIFIFYDPKRNLGNRRLEGLELRSVAPTILEQLRVPPPQDIKVKQIEVG